VNPLDVRTQLEAEWTWRSDELRFLHNQLSILASEDEKERFRRSLVVMLYAHLEGFCKMAFTIYVDALNGEGLTLADVTDILGAAAMADVFDALANRDKKNDVFRTSLPTDEKLHALARRKDFLAEFNQFKTRPLRIDADTVVNTESNLKPAVLKKLLFVVGLDPALSGPWEGSLHKLLNRRNGIAHGSERTGVGDNLYRDLETTVTVMVTALIQTIHAACVDGRHLR